MHQPIQLWCTLAHSWLYSFHPEVPGLCHASYCVPYTAESLQCVVSAWLLRQCGVLRPGARGPFGCCRVNTCGSEGLPLPGDCTHNITLPSPLAFSSRGRPNIRNCRMWSSFSHFKFPSPLRQNSPGTHQSRGLLGKWNWKCPLRLPFSHS